MNNKSNVSLYVFLIAFFIVVYIIFFSKVQSCSQENKDNIQVFPSLFKEYVENLDNMKLQEDLKKEKDGLFENESICKKLNEKRKNQTSQQKYQDTIQALQTDKCLKLDVKKVNDLWIKTLANPRKKLLLGDANKPNPSIQETSISLTPGFFKTSDINEYLYCPASENLSSLNSDQTAIDYINTKSKERRNQEPSKFINMLMKTDNGKYAMIIDPVTEERPKPNTYEIVLVQIQEGVLKVVEYLPFQFLWKLWERLTFI